MEERNCSKCVYARPYGGENDNRCASWSCEFIDYKDAVKAYYRQKKQGEWIDSEVNHGHIIRSCSACGGYISTERLRAVDRNWGYCPWCGAKMKGANDELVQR